MVHWCALRDSASSPEWSVPDTGFIVEDVAMGFFILLSNNCGFLDFYVTNPQASKTERAEALRRITLELIETAKEIGIQMLMCNTQSESIKNLAKEFGFKSDGEFSCFSMEI